MACGPPVKGVDSPPPWGSSAAAPDMRPSRVNLHALRGLHRVGRLRRGARSPQGRHDEPFYGREIQFVQPSAARERPTYESSGPSMSHVFSSTRGSQSTTDWRCRAVGAPRWMVHGTVLRAASRKLEWAPSPWSLANDAHEASWSRSTGPTEYKVVRPRSPGVASRRTRELRLGTTDHLSAATGQRWRRRSMS